MGDSPADQHAAAAVQAPPRERLVDLVRTRALTSEEAVQAILTVSAANIAVLALVAALEKLVEKLEAAGHPGLMIELQGALDDARSLSRQAASEILGARPSP